MPTQDKPTRSLLRDNASQENNLSGKAKFIGDYLSAINAASGVNTTPTTLHLISPIRFAMTVAISISGISICAQSAIAITSIT